jgi:hypothetical protein
LEERVRTARAVSKDSERRRWATGDPGVGFWAKPLQSRRAEKKNVAEEAKGRFHLRILMPRQYTVVRL